MNRRFLFILSIAFALTLACKSNKAPEISLEPSTDGMYKFKALGLNDTAVTDSVWRMIFTVQGIDQISITQNDSNITFKITDETLEPKTLIEEIEKRGATVIGRVH